MEETILPNICRACMTDKATFQSIFVPDESTGLTIHLAEMIMAYASVQITLGDGLPETICSECAKAVSQFYIFKLKCEETDKNLRCKLGKSPLMKPYSILEEQDQYHSTFDLDGDTTENVIIKPEIYEVVSEDTDAVNKANNFNSIDDSFDCEENYDNSDDVSITDEKLVKDDLQVGDIIEVGLDLKEIEKDDINAENKEGNLSCEVCLKAFTTRSILNRHKRIHDDKIFECDVCNKSFTRNDILKRHKRTHDNKSEEEIIIPDNVSIEDLIDLKLQVEFRCTICDIIWDNEENYQAHMEGHNKQSSKESLTCGICKKKFLKNSHLNRHMKIHAAVKPYNCVECKKGFARAEQLNHHMNIHSGIKPHVCKICSKGFNQISNLKDHMRTHNGEKPFLCSTCGKGFNQLGNLRQHTIRHSGIKAHLCSICGNGFASKGELCAHLRKHTGARPFVCDICNHGFTTSSSLTKHKRIHSGEKPYECEVCKMKFSRSGILARHKRTHTGEKPYVCKYCTKAFSQSNDLSSHLRIHTGEKPYICDVCGQAFRQSSALKTHKKTHIDKSTSFPIDSRVIINMVQIHKAIEQLKGWSSKRHAR